jgi:hypothetical protein
MWSKVGMALSALVDHRGIVAVHGQEPHGEFDNPLAAVDHSFDILENRMNHTGRLRSLSKRSQGAEELLVELQIFLTTLT